MNSVFKLSCSRMALLTAFGLAISFTPVSAADLGGDCCADLEERVAELEATTARKGNRKVSLTISGWVNEAVFAWDDGVERNAYVGTNSLEQSRFRFVGEAQISPGYSAGYTLEIGTQGHASNKFDQTTDASSGDNMLTVRKSNWWLKSKDYGKVTVGLEGTATYHLLDDADIANTRNVSDAQAAAVALGSFGLRNNGNFLGSSSNSSIGLRWSDVLRGVDNNTDGQNGRRNIVRYDSPEIAGFVVTASWGEDDMWGVSTTYKNKWGDFLVIAKAGYEQNSDEGTSQCSSTPSALTIPSGPAHQNCAWWGAAGSIMHAPTGLYVYGGWGENHDYSEAQVTQGGFSPDADDQLWFIQGGIEQKWIPLGKTTIFGEYRQDNGGSNLAKGFAAGGGAAGDLKTEYIHDSQINNFAAGIVQNIEPAAMDLYVVYRHADGDVTNASGDTASLDAFDMVIMGAMMKF
ncbi:MAG TPA: porin [Hyphomicrobium sp.]